MEGDPEVFVGPGKKERQQRAALLQSISSLFQNKPSSIARRRSSSREYGISAGKKEPISVTEWRDDASEHSAGDISDSESESELATDNDEVGKAQGLLQRKNSNLSLLISTGEDDMESYFDDEEGDDKAIRNINYSANELLVERARKLRSIIEEESRGKKVKSKNRKKYDEMTEKLMELRELKGRIRRGETEGHKPVVRWTKKNFKRLMGQHDNEGDRDVDEFEDADRRVASPAEADNAWRRSTRLIRQLKKVDIFNRGKGEEDDSSKRIASTFCSPETAQDDTLMPTKRRMHRRSFSSDSTPLMIPDFMPKEKDDASDMTMAIEGDDDEHHVTRRTNANNNNLSNNSTSTSSGIEQEQHKLQSVHSDINPSILTLPSHFRSRFSDGAIDSKMSFKPGKSAIVASKKPRGEAQSVSSIGDIHDSTEPTFCVAEETSFPMGTHMDGGVSIPYSNSTSKLGKMTPTRSLARFIRRKKNPSHAHAQKQNQADLEAALTSYDAETDETENDEDEEGVSEFDTTDGFVMVEKSNKAAIPIVRHTSVYDNAIVPEGELPFKLESGSKPPNSKGKKKRDNAKNKQSKSKRSSPFHVGDGDTTSLQSTVSALSGSDTSSRHHLSITPSPHRKRSESDYSDVTEGDEGEDEDEYGTNGTAKVNADFHRSPKRKMEGFFAPLYGKKKKKQFISELQQEYQMKLEAREKAFRRQCEKRYSVVSGRVDALGKDLERERELVRHQLTRINAIKNVLDVREGTVAVAEENLQRDREILVKVIVDFYEDIQKKLKRNTSNVDQVTEKCEELEHLSNKYINAIKQTQEEIREHQEEMRDAMKLNQTLRSYSFLQFSPTNDQQQPQTHQFLKIAFAVVAVIGVFELLFGLFFLFNWK
eukprot:m.108462 g.108462  ORF g.108462 m.108462 type:complete len:880 (-) comp9190_c1_seq2:56-2695(-)